MQFLCCFVVAAAAANTQHTYPTCPKISLLNFYRFSLSKLKFRQKWVYTTWHAIVCFGAGNITQCTMHTHTDIQNEECSAARLFISIILVLSRFLSFFIFNQKWIWIAFTLWCVFVLMKINLVDASQIGHMYSYVLFFSFYFHNVNDGMWNMSRSTGFS